MGDARGWWEGDTLVVQTRNFRADTAPQGAQREGDDDRAVHGDLGRHRSSGRVTFDDATVWTRPWTFSMPLTRVGTDQQVIEYACHEGNHAMRNILSAQRASERAAGAARSLTPTLTPDPSGVASHPRDADC